MRMEYELYFIDNMYDSMDMVNLEVKLFLEFFGEDNFDETIVKHSILYLANCLELLVKYRLEEEHWALVFADLNKAKFSDYLEGDFISVDVKSGISRLKNICEIDYVFENSMRIYRYRNRLMHYTLMGNYQQIIKELSGSMEEIAEFVEKEIIQYLPQEVQKDFRESIANYRKHATALRELEL